MGYRSPSETRLATHVTKAITEYGLIEHGDRVMVGLSGGTDSWVPLALIADLEREHPLDSASMIKALTNVMPRHLPDRRLPVAASDAAKDPERAGEGAAEFPFGQLVELRSR